MPKLHTGTVYAYKILGAKNVICPSVRRILRSDHCRRWWCRE